MREWPGWFCIVGTVSTALASAGGCRQIAGISDSPPQALTSSVCGLPYGTSTCAACVHESCCSESTACAADDACAAYEGCLGPCNGDPECRSQCGIDHPGGIASNVVALSTCLAAHCESECGLTCGGVADLISPPSAAKACEKCVTTSACTQAEVCASSAPCNGYLRFATLATADSAEVYQEQQCASDAASGLSFNIGGLVEVCGNHPAFDADAGLSSQADSFKYTCASACATGNDWSCVGHVTWPPPKGASSTIGLKISDYVTPGTPVSGALAQVCAPSDFDCVEPLAHGTTDANGTLSLTVSNEPAGGTQGLNGFIRISGPNIQTQDSYWGFPLVETHFPVAYSEVVTPSEFQLLSAEANAPPVAGRGELTVYVLDCLYNVAPGVNVTVASADSLTKSFSTTAAATTVTDSTGLIFFDNVPSGVTTVTATPMGLNKPAAQTRVYIQPNISTLVTVWKTPTTP